MLSCAASTNFSRVDIGGSWVLELTAPKLGTTHNIRLVCLPLESSWLSCGDGAWSGTATVPLPGGGAGLVCLPLESSWLSWGDGAWLGTATVPLADGGAGAEFPGGVGFCWAFSTVLDWS